MKIYQRNSKCPECKFVDYNNEWVGTRSEWNDMCSTSIMWSNRMDCMKCEHNDTMARFYLTKKELEESE